MRINHLFEGGRVQCNQPPTRWLTSTPREIFLYEVLRVAGKLWCVQGSFDDVEVHVADSRRNFCPCPHDRLWSPLASTGVTGESLPDTPRVGRFIYLIRTFSVLGFSWWAFLWGTKKPDTLRPFSEAEQASSLESTLGRWAIGWVFKRYWEYWALHFVLKHYKDQEWRRTHTMDIRW